MILARHTKAMNQETLK